MDLAGFPPEGASRALLRRLGAGEHTAAANADTAGHAETDADTAGAGSDLRMFAPLPVLAATTERPITADQTHRSIVVGEQVVVKWFRPPMPPPHRALAILGHLAAVGFERTARPYAAVLAGADLTALITAYLPDAVDGYEWCVEAVVAGTPIGADLGELTADLHDALATPSSDLPAPVSTAVDPDRYARAVSALVEALDRTDDHWFHAIAPRLRDGLTPLRDAAPSQVMQIHGDLHVGQVLRWTCGYAVIDFDGNPTMTTDAPQPAARDVAQMQTSIEHVGQIALRRGAPHHAAAAWVRSTVDDFRAAYADRLAKLGHADLFDADLVRPFTIEQECRELIYAARFLPRWRYAPIGVLKSWYGED